MLEINDSSRYKQVYEYLEDLLETKGKFVDSFCRKFINSPLDEEICSVYYYKHATVILSCNQARVRNPDYKFAGFDIKIQAGHKTEQKIYEELKDAVKKGYVESKIYLSDLHWWFNEFEAQKKTETWCLDLSSYNDLTERKRGVWAYPPYNDLTERKLERIIHEYPLIPPVIDDFLENHTKRISMGENLRCKGKISYHEPILFSIEIDKNQSKQEQAITLYHECGHAIYKCAGDKTCMPGPQEEMLDKAAKQFIKKFPEQAKELMEKYLKE